MNSQFSIQRITGASAPGSITNDNVLAILTVPANIFGPLVGEIAELAFQASGLFGVNGDNKTLKAILNPINPVVGQAVVGGTTLLTTGVVAQSGGGWNMNGCIVRTGVNTQLFLNEGTVVGTTHQGTTAAQALAMADSAAIVVVITGNAGTLVGDLNLQYAEMYGMA
jgi:hypothetical protein